MRPDHGEAARGAQIIADFVHGHGKHGARRRLAKNDLVDFGNFCEIAQSFGRIAGRSADHGNGLIRRRSEAFPHYPGDLFGGRAFLRPPVRGVKKPLQALVIVLRVGK